VVAHFDLNFDMSSIDDAVHILSQQTRRCLLAAYERSSASHLYLLTFENLETLETRNEQQSSLLYATILATGLLFVGDSDPECQMQRTSKTDRTSLHKAVKDAIEMNDLLADSGSHVSTLLLFSELERYAGFAGSANMYLKETARVLFGAQKLEFSKSNLSQNYNSNHWLRSACEQLLLQWSIFGLCRQPLTDILVDSTPADTFTTSKENAYLDTNNLEEATHYAHGDLLRASKNLAWNAHSHTVINASPKLTKRLQKWCAELPIYLQWASRGESWKAGTFLLHQQYQTLMTLANPSKVKELIQTVSEYERIYSLRNAPLIVAHHIEVACSFAEKAQDRYRLMQMLSILSENHPAARKMLAALGSRQQIEELERVQTTENSQRLQTNVFSLDYADLNTSDVCSDVLQEDSRSLGEQEVQSVMVDQVASRSPGLDPDDSVLIYLNDPVFGGYIEELGHNTSHSGELWKRSVQQTGQRSRADQVSSETWRGNDMAEQLRAFLGHDIGIRGPDVADMSLEERASEAQWDMHSRMQTMTT
jgi:hypothetical protein